MTTTAAAEIVVVVGAGSMGQAIAQRIGVGKVILLVDLKPENATAAAEALATAGYTTDTAHVDIADRESVSPGRDRCRSRVGDTRGAHRRTIASPGVSGGHHRRRPDWHRPRPGGVRTCHCSGLLGHRHRQSG